MPLEDYTLHIRFQKAKNLYSATVDEFHGLVGFGKTEAQAKEDLRVKFEERINELRVRGERIPHPGEKPTLKFAESDRIRQQEELARDFFARVYKLDFDELFISDRTLIEDFELTPKDLIQRIQQCYGINANPVIDQPIWRILEYIESQKKFEA